MKRKIVNMGTIGIVVIILLVGVLNYKQAAETEMKKIETEENSVRENKTNYTYEQDSSNICELVKKVDFRQKNIRLIGRFIQIRWNWHIKRTFIGSLQIRCHWSMGKKRLSIFGIIYEGYLIWMTWSL